MQDLRNFSLALDFVEITNEPVERKNKACGIGV
jgi:hypothetical protein